MKERYSGLILALFLAAQGALSAQDQAAPDKAPRRMLFAMEKGLLSGYSSDEMIVLKRSFLTALADADGAPIPIDYGTRSFPGSLQDRNKAAREAGADCWLLLRVAGLRGSPSLSVVAYDLLYNIKSLDFGASRSEAFSMLDIYRERWDDIVPAVVKKFPPLVSRAYSRGPPAAVTLTLHAVPGTVITGLSPKALVVGPDGTASLELPSPAPYAFRATAWGYVPSQMRMYLDGPTEVTVDQVRSPWLRLDAAFLDGLFPGASASFSIPSLPFFVRLGFTTFRAGIAVNNQDQVLASIPLSQVTLLLGSYTGPEDRPARGYLGAGPLLRISLPPGAQFFTIDQLLPWGVQVVAGAEFQLAARLRVFVEYAPSGYSTPEPALFLASFGKDGGTFPYINFPPSWALDPFELRFGLRWAP